MTIYIQSRGKNQDQDYRWLKIKSNECYPENPEFLLQPINSFKVRSIDLIESQKPSIILISKHNDYCLLVTGLNAREERSDFTGRLVRNSILWICRKDSKDSKDIRSFLIDALRGELEEKIDSCINNSDNEYGFEVDYLSLQELINDIKVESNNNTDTNNKIGNNSEYLRQKLALELENNPLPDIEGLLVLVTSIKSASSLKEISVWRGLSNRVIYEEFEDYSFSVTESQQGQKKTVYISIAIALILIIAISIVIIQFLKLQKPQPEINPNDPILQKQSQKLLDKAGTSTELPSDCQKAKEEIYILSPCSLNMSKNL